MVTLLATALSFASQSPDTKKEEFRRYLERSGVIDALTKGELVLKTAAALVELAIMREYVTSSPPTPSHTRVFIPLGSVSGPL